MKKLIYYASSEENRMLVCRFDEHRDTHKKHAWRVFYAWLPVVLVLMVIVGLTLQDAEGIMQMTESVQAVVVPAEVAVAHADWDITSLLRKLAHTVEYFFLGLTAMFAFYHTSPRKCGLKALGFCAVVSFLDQCLKGCLPTREFDATDFPFDIAGYVLGVWVMAVVMVMWSRRKAKRVG